MNSEKRSKDKEDKIEREKNSRFDSFPNSDLKLNMWNLYRHDLVTDQSKNNPNDWYKN
jgi:hypothetical protein